MPIKPVSIPDAASLNYGEGSVRHFQRGDDVSVPGISNPTRQLAHRDVILAQSLNEVIKTVNNKEQFVPLNIVPTTLPQDSTIVIANYRIPSGFEARVLNAAITGTPVSGDLELNVYYSTTFGATTGEQIVSTATEFTSGSEFQNTGELVVELKNKGDVTVDAIASVLLTMRPIGETGGLLLTSAAPPTVGPPGPQGAPGVGIQGPAGAVGSAGMVWTGAWNSGASYAPPQVVSFNSGSGTSSYIALSNTTAGQSPSTSPSKWDLVASAGSSGTGSTGPAGQDGFNFRGEWNAGATYVAQDVVTYTTGTTQGTFYAGLNGTIPSVGVAPAGAGWTALFAQSIPVFSSQSVEGFFYTESDYVEGVSFDGYQVVAAGTYPLTFEETKMVGPNSPQGMSFIKSMQQLSFGGAITVRLPTVAEGGAAVNYLTDDATVSVDAVGTVILTGSNQFTVFNPLPRATTLSLRADSLIS